MGNLQNNQFETIQTSTMPKPPTVASAATIAPTTKLTFVTGTVALETITPNDVQAYQEITLCFTDANPTAFLTSGNIMTAYDPQQNRPVDLCYDPVSKKWWVKAVV